MPSFAPLHVFQKWFRPLGVEVIRSFVVSPDEIVGYTEAKNSSYPSMKATSSRYRKLTDLPRIALEDVVPANTWHPFSNAILPLFHSSTPCCNHLGNASNANLIRAITSRDASPLFARIATVLNSLNRI